MSGVIQDLRYAVRQVRKAPGFALVAVLTLALGIGANTAIFSLINAIMLRTLSVKDPRGLVLLKWKAKGIPQTKGSSSYANCPQGSGPALQGGDIISDVPLDSQGCSFSFPFFQQLQNNPKIFSSVGAFVPAQFSVNFEGRTDLVRGLLVSGDFFRTLGLQAAMGRELQPADDMKGAPPTVFLSHQFWKSHLGGREIVGKYVRIGKTMFTVAGVTRPEFATLDPGVSCDVWLPLAFQGSLPPYRPQDSSSGATWLEILGRLQPGVEPGRAAAALSAAFASTTTNGPDAVFKIIDAPQIELSSVVRGLATLRRTFSQPLFTLLTAVALVLVLSSVNIAGLMLARSASRTKEFGTRLALGATRRRVIRQQLAESMVLSIAGGTIGLLFGEIGARALASYFARNWYMPLELDVHADPHVLTFTLLVSVLVGIAFGLAPAVSTTRQDVASAFRAGTRGAFTGSGRRMSTGNLILLAQIAVAVPILVGAGLIARTLDNLQAQNVGFDPHQLVVFRVDSTYSQKNPSRLYQDLREQLASLPGVLSVSRSAVSLLSNEGMAGPIFLSGHSSSVARAHFLPMSSNFPETMRIPLLQGRAFSDEKSEKPRSKNAPTEVVVNNALVRQVFGAQNPLGKHFLSPTGTEFEITGVMADAKYGTMRETIWPTVYAPIAGWDGNVYYEVRTAADPNTLMPEIRTTVERFDSNLLVTGMRTEVEQIAHDIYQERLLAILSGLFAVLALIITCIGVYGLLAFQVVRRTQEIGIRLAVGAKPGHVLWLVISQGSAIVLAGALVGSAAAIPLTRYLQSVLFGVKPTDPLTVMAAVVLLVTTAALASYVPARRAMKVDPMAALRYE